MPVVRLGAGEAGDQQSHQRLRQSVRKRPPLLLRRPARASRAQLVEQRLRQLRQRLGLPARQEPQQRGDRVNVAILRRQAPSVKEQELEGCATNRRS